jgi:hypothetical protein
MGVNAVGVTAETDVIDSSELTTGAPPEGDELPPPPHDTKFASAPALVENIAERTTTVLKVNLIASLRVVFVFI